MREKMPGGKSRATPAKPSLPSRSLGFRTGGFSSKSKSKNPEIISITSTSTEQLRAGTGTDNKNDVNISSKKLLGGIDGTKTPAKNRTSKFLANARRKASNSMQRQTFLANNKALARSLQRVKEENAQLKSENVELRGETNDLRSKVAALESGNGLDFEKAVDEKVKAQLKEVMSEVDMLVTDVTQNVSRGVDSLLRIQIVAKSHISGKQNRASGSSSAGGTPNEVAGLRNIGCRLSSFGGPRRASMIHDRPSLSASFDPPKELLLAALGKGAANTNTMAQADNSCGRRGGSKGSSDRGAVDLSVVLETSGLDEEVPVAFADEDDGHSSSEEKCLPTVQEDEVLFVAPVVKQGSSSFSVAKPERRTSILLSRPPALDSPGFEGNDSIESGDGSPENSADDINDAENSKIGDPEGLVEESDKSISDPDTPTEKKRLESCSSGSEDSSNRDIFDPEASWSEKSAEKKSRRKSSSDLSDESTLTKSPKSQMDNLCEEQPPWASAESAKGREKSVNSGKKSPFKRKQEAAGGLEETFLVVKKDKIEASRKESENEVVDKRRTYFVRTNSNSVFSDAAQQKPVIAAHQSSMNEIQNPLEPVVPAETKAKLNQAPGVSVTKKMAINKGRFFAPRSKDKQKAQAKPKRVVPQKPKEAVPYPTIIGRTPVKTDERMSVFDISSSPVSPKKKTKFGDVSNSNKQMERSQIAGPSVPIPHDEIPVGTHLKKNGELFEQLLTPDQPERPVSDHSRTVVKEKFDKRKNESTKMDKKGVTNPELVSKVIAESDEEEEAVRKKSPIKRARSKRAPSKKGPESKTQDNENETDRRREEEGGERENKAEQSKVEPELVEAELPRLPKKRARSKKAPAKKQKPAREENKEEEIHNTTEPIMEKNGQKEEPENRPVSSAAVLEQDVNVSFRSDVSEGLVTERKSRRARNAGVSYKEPLMKGKLRRGDKYGLGN